MQFYSAAQLQNAPGPVSYTHLCAPAQVFSIVLSDILGDPLDMIASGPAVPDTSTCAQALAIAEKYHLKLSEPVSYTHLYRLCSVPVQFSAIQRARYFGK